MTKMTGINIFVSIFKSKRPFSFIYLSLLLSQPASRTILLMKFSLLHHRYTLVCIHTSLRVEIFKLVYIFCYKVLCVIIIGVSILLVFHDWCNYYHCLLTSYCISATYYLQRCFVLISAYLSIKSFFTLKQTHISVVIIINNFLYHMQWKFYMINFSIFGQIIVNNDFPKL